MLRVHGDARGSIAGSERPSLGDLERLGVDFHYDAFVFEVVVDVTFAVRHGKLWLPVKLERPNHVAGGRVDGSRAAAAAVEGEHTLREGVVNDSVRARVGGGRTEHLERLEIENGNGVGAAVARETAAEIRSDGDAVDPLRVGNVAHHRIGIGVEDHDMGATRDVKPAPVRVHLQIVPTSITTQNHFLDEVIAT